MQYSEKVLDRYASAQCWRDWGRKRCRRGQQRKVRRYYEDLPQRCPDDGIIEDVKFKTFGCGAANHNQLDGYRMK